MSLLSRKIQEIPPSATLALVAKAAQLRAEGKRVISFAAGELDFPTPEPIVAGTIEALHGGLTKYTPSGGLPDLRRAAAGYMSRQLEADIREENVAITLGAKQGIFNVLVSILNPGDKVIILSPYWVSYPSMVTLAGGKGIIVDTKPEEGFKASGNDIASLAEKEKPRAILMNSPSNPTGAVYSPQEMRSIHDVCRKENIFIISDEIYSNILFDGLKHFSAFHLEGKINDAFCVIDGMSKSFSMTGWRIGWVVGSPGLVKAVSKVTAQTTSCAVSFIQKGCVGALGRGLDDYDEWMRQLDARRSHMVSLLSSIDGVECHRPQGAFYLWVDVRGLFSGRLPGGKALKSSVELSGYLVDDCALVVVPGSAFGCEGFMRFSFAVSMQEIEEGISLFRRSIEKLS